MIQILFGVLEGSDLLILLNICHIRMYVRKLYAKMLTASDKVGRVAAFLSITVPRETLVLYLSEKLFMAISTSVSGKE